MTDRQKQLALARLKALNERYLTAHLKLHEAIVACRSTDLDGNALCTYAEIAQAVGITRQSVHEYVKRWELGYRTP